MELLRCWLCGVEPDAIHEVMSLESENPIARIPEWPAATDHQHAEQPPSPADLEREGHKTLLRVRGLAT